MARSYNGWPASRDPKAIGVNRSWEPLPDVRFPGGVKSGDVEFLFTLLVRWLDAEVEPADTPGVDDEWGFHYKPPANNPDADDDGLSCHSSATAIDYNATRHPNRKRGTWTPAQMAAIRRILARFDGVMGWLALQADGGNARSVPDEMHFEIRGNAQQVAAVAARLRASIPDDQEDQMTPDQMAELKAHIDARVNSAADATVQTLAKRIAAIPGAGSADPATLAAEVADELAERLARKPG